MEPRSIERGKLYPHCVRPELIVASMEPRSIERGKAARIPDLDLNSDASMEPRSIERGKPLVGGEGIGKSLSFNGAAIN